MPDFENEQPDNNLNHRSSNYKKTNNKPFISKNPDSVGACWVRENKNGVEYLSMKIEVNGVELNFKGFLNAEKLESDNNKPKFLIFKSLNGKK